MYSTINEIEIQRKQQNLPSFDEWQKEFKVGSLYSKHIPDEHDLTPEYHKVLVIREMQKLNHNLNN